MSKPFFSIIVATYNHAHLLPACLDSIEGQTFQDWECLIVNNYSTDNTEEVVAGYNDSRLKMLYVHNEGILAKSRNVGIENCSGKWICMLDSDDIWYNNKLEELYQAIGNNPEVDVICHNLVMNNMVTGEKSLMTGRAFEPDVYKELLLHRNFMAQSSLAYNNAFLCYHCLRYNELPDYVTVEDYDFSLRLAKSGAEFHKIDKVLGEWRVYGTNWSSSPIHIRNIELMLKNHVFNIQDFEPNKSKLWKDVQSGILIKEANSRKKKKEYFSFIRLYTKAFLKSPKRFFRYLSDRSELSIKRIKYKNQ